MKVTKQQMEDQIEKTKKAMQPDSLRYHGLTEIMSLIALTIPYIESMIEKLEKRNERK